MDILLQNPPRSQKERQDEKNENKNVKPKKIPIA
jgi:hypothetical protein